jgi:mycothiol system anti-sigma-R factor
MSHIPDPNSPFGNATCMEMLQVVLDGQASEEQVHYWKSHLGLCQPCYEKYKVDVAIKEMVKAECCCSKIPQDVIEQLSHKIKQIA